MLGAVVGFLKGPIPGVVVSAATYAYMRKFGHHLPGGGDTTTPQVVVTQQHASTQPGTDDPPAVGHHHSQAWLVTDN